MCFTSALEHIPHGLSLIFNQARELHNFFNWMLRILIREFYLNRSWTTGSSSPLTSHRDSDRISSRCWIISLGEAAEVSLAPTVGPNPAFPRARAVAVPLQGPAPIAAQQGVSGTCVRGYGTSTLRCLNAEKWKRSGSHPRSMRRQSYR
jgi:hypothetical protein